MAVLSKDEARRARHQKGQKRAMEGRKCPKCGRGNALTKDRLPDWNGKHCRYCDYEVGMWLA